MSMNVSNGWCSESRPAERTIGEQPDAVREAIAGHTAEDMVVVPDAQLDLDGIDVGETPRLLDLPDGHVAETNPLNQPVSLQRSQPTDAGRERSARIRHVELIEVDAVDAERRATLAARVDQVFRDRQAPIGRPAAGSRLSSPAG